ncbi:dihydrodipicolinate synthase family protein [Spirillospora sp. CA-255316]
MTSAAVKLALPAADGSLVPYALGEPRAFARPAGPARSRVAFAAAHVVPDPFSERSTLDWDTTLAFRRHLWSYGLGVAEAMDTAQRGMGLEWETTKELIRRSGAEARAHGGLIACGAGTDQLEPGPASLDRVVAAYEEQLAVVAEAGAVPILMASRQLTASAKGPDDYAKVYGRLLGQLDRPAILHWLGPMFDPALEGYWGAADLDAAADAVLAIITEHESKVDGIKVSLLDADREIAIRRRLPASVRLYTGDDFNYPDLIRGDDQGHSDALLGIFDPIAPAAATALHALDDGDLATYEDVFSPTLPLARHIFETPTYYYKTGVVFLAWLAGHQRHFRMVGGLESARSVPHLVRLFKLADAAGLLPDPELAASRMRAWLTVQGVPQ